MNTVFETQEHILDREFSTLSLSEQVDMLTIILDELVEASMLIDLKYDLLELGDCYDWVPRHDADLERFKMLNEKVSTCTLEENEVNEFMDMASGVGQYHPYFLVRKARTLQRGSE